MAAEKHLLIFEGASAGRYPQRSRPSEQRSKNRQMPSAHRVAEITGRGLRWLRGLLARPLLRIRYGSPLRGCSREADLPAAHGLPGRCFASATAFRNGLYAI
jgi:hypothetical protein